MANMDKDMGILGDIFIRLWNFLSRKMLWACGAYFFCLREAFKETGGFDEKYYISEEIEFSNAFEKMGQETWQKIRDP